MRRRIPISVLFVSGWKVGDSDPFAVTFYASHPRLHKPLLLTRPVRAPQRNQSIFRSCIAQNIASVSFVFGARKFASSKNPSTIKPESSFSPSAAHLRFYYVNYAHQVPGQLLGVQATNRKVQFTQNSKNTFIFQLFFYQNGRHTQISTPFDYVHENPNGYVRD